MITDIENVTIDKDTEYEETIINWRKRLGKVQLRCPYCDYFFNIPNDVKINYLGYASDSIYHICDENDNPKEVGWVVTPHLIGWGE